MTNELVGLDEKIAITISVFVNVFVLIVGVWVSQFGSISIRYFSHQMGQ